MKTRPEKPRIMIVEDEIIIAADLKVHLSQMGYDVCASVSSAEKAIELAGVLVPDLVLMDIVLAGPMDGIEAAEVIRSSFNVPVVFLTAYADEEKLYRAKLTLPFGYVLKPFQSGELRVSIEMALFVSQADQERRQALVRLRKSEALLQAIMDHAPALISVRDPKGNYIMVNRRFELLKKNPLKEYIGRNVSELFPVDLATTLLHQDAETLNADGQMESEINMIHKDMTNHHYHTVKFPLKGEDGVPFGICTIATDMTERKTAEEALAWEAGVNASIAELSGLLIRADTLNNISRLVLERSQRLTGSEVGFVGYVDQDKGLLFNPLLTEGAMNICRIPGNSIEFTKSKGLWDWVMNNKKPVLSNDPQQDPRFGGSPLGHIVIDRVLSAPAMVGDNLVGLVTVANAGRDYNQRDLDLLERLAFLYGLAIQRKRTEEDLVRTKEEAEAANRAKSEFLANISHELRTPLTPIIGLTEMALDTELDDQQRDYLTDVKKSALNLLNIINDLLDICHIDAGRINLEKQPLDIVEIIQVVINQLTPEARKKGLDLQARFDLGPVKMYWADIQYVSDVLYKLIGNAIKFTNRGQVEVSVSQEPGKDNLVLIHLLIRDTGIGIPPSHLEYIFERFTQGDGSMTRKFGGIGLGLNKAKSLVQLMGGRLRVESDLGQGTTVHVILPLEEVHSQ